MALDKIEAGWISQMAGVPLSDDESAPLVSTASASGPEVPRDEGLDKALGISSSSESDDDDDDDEDEETAGAQEPEKGEDFDEVSIEKYKEEIEGLQKVVCTWAEKIERSKFTSQVLDEAEGLLISSAELLSKLDNTDPETQETEHSVLKGFDKLLERYNTLRPIAKQLVASASSGCKRVRRTPSGD